MRTLGNRWEQWPHPAGGTANCDYCGVKWPRSKLVRDGAGLLRCPDEGPGADATSLAQENARLALRSPAPAWIDGVARSDLVPSPLALFRDDLIAYFRAWTGPRGMRSEGSSEFPDLVDQSLWKPIGNTVNAAPNLFTGPAAPNGKAYVNGPGTGLINERTAPSLVAGSAISMWMVARERVSATSTPAVAQGVSQGGTTEINVMRVSMSGGLLTIGTSNQSLLSLSSFSASRFQRAVFVWNAGGASAGKLGLEEYSGQQCLPWTGTATLGIRFRTVELQVAEVGYCYGNILTKAGALDDYFVSTYGTDILT